MYENLVKAGEMKSCNSVDFMLRGTEIPPGLHEYTDGYQISLWQTMNEEVKSNRSTGVCIGAVQP